MEDTSPTGDPKRKALQGSTIRTCPWEAEQEGFPDILAVANDFCLLAIKLQPSLPSHSLYHLQIMPKVLHIASRGSIIQVEHLQFRKQLGGKLMDS